MQNSVNVYLTNYHFSVNPSSNFGKIWNLVLINQRHPLLVVGEEEEEGEESSSSSGSRAKSLVRVMVGSLHRE